MSKENTLLLIRNSARYEEVICQVEMFIFAKLSRTREQECFQNLFKFLLKFLLNIVYFNRCGNATISCYIFMPFETFVHAGFPLQRNVFRRISLVISATVRTRFREIYRRPQGGNENALHFKSRVCYWIFSFELL